MEIIAIIVFAALIALVIWLKLRTNLLKSGESAARAKADELSRKLEQINPAEQIRIAVADAEVEVRENTQAVAAARGDFARLNRQISDLVDQNGAAEQKIKQMMLDAGAIKESEMAKDEGSRNQAELERANSLERAARSLARGIEANNERLGVLRPARDRADAQIKSALEKLKDKQRKIEEFKTKGETLGVAIATTEVTSEIENSISGWDGGDSKLGTLEQKIANAQDVLNRMTAEAETIREIQEDDLGRIISEYDANSADARADDLIAKIMATDESSSAPADS